MKPKPKHLGQEYATQFQEQSVVDAYRYRPPYPPQTFEILAGLMRSEPKNVLDIGCGTGKIARGLAPFVEGIDAVDFSAAMIVEAERLSRGVDANIRWLLGAVETVSLSPPYAMVTAGGSIHWMEWETVLPRLRKVLAPGGYLALVNVGQARPPHWAAALRPIIARYSTNRDFQPYNIVDELESRGLLRKVGARSTDPAPFVQTVEESIESFHSQNGFSRERMQPEEAAAFDAEVRELVTRHAGQGKTEIEIVGEIIWGIPLQVEA